MSNDALWLWMQQLFGIGTRRAHTVLERYGSPDELLSMQGKRLEQDSFFTSEEKKAIASPNLNKYEKYIDEAKNKGVLFITPDSEYYPEELRNIHSPPLILSAKGDLSLLRDHYLITMVGSRKPDTYGLSAAQKLSSEIADLGGVVVSGMALGIDVASHKGALDAGGTTIAILAAGIDIDYPQFNKDVRNRIEKNGLVLTEYMMGTTAMPYNFPIRNRLLSGISLATVIVQAARHGGTMLTAAHALSQNKDLFAVPGSIFMQNMEGCNWLLSEGAIPALSGEYILMRYPEIYGYELVEKKTIENNKRPDIKSTDIKTEKPVKDAPVHLSLIQEKVYVEITAEGNYIDELCEKANLGAGELLSIITQLELFGLVQMRPGRKVVLIERGASNR